MIQAYGQVLWMSCKWPSSRWRAGMAIGQSRSRCQPTWQGNGPRGQKLFLKTGSKSILTWVVSRFPQATTTEELDMFGSSGRSCDFFAARSEQQLRSLDEVEAIILDLFKKYDQDPKFDGFSWKVMSILGRSVDKRRKVPIGHSSSFFKPSLLSCRIPASSWIQSSSKRWCKTCSSVSTSQRTRSCSSWPRCKGCFQGELEVKFTLYKTGVGWRCMMWWYAWICWYYMFWTYSYSLHWTSETDYEQAVPKFVESSRHLYKIGNWELLSMIFPGSCMSMHFVGL